MVAPFQQGMAKRDDSTIYEEVAGSEEKLNSLNVAKVLQKTGWVMRHRFPNGLIGAIASQNSDMHITESQFSVREDG